MFKTTCKLKTKFSFLHHTLAKLIMTSMLEYFKMILKKVSFERSLFEKELKKAISRLVGTEIKELKDWCYQNFSVRHRVVLDKCFK